MSIYLHIGASAYTRTGAPHTPAPVCVYVCVDTSPHRRLPSNARKKHARNTLARHTLARRAADGRVHWHVHTSFLSMLQRTHLCRLCVRARACARACLRATRHAPDPVQHEPLSETPRLHQTPNNNR